MKNIKLELSAAAVFVGTFVVFPMLFAEARPKYMDLYNEDAYSKAKLQDNCSICHLTKTGGGERTYFGEAFDDAGRKFTPELRQKYPQYFESKPEKPLR